MPVKESDMQTVFGAYTAWIDPVFMVEEGMPYPLEDVAHLWRAHPDAFVDDITKVPGRERDGAVEQATAAPGERRPRRDG